MPDGTITETVHEVGQVGIGYALPFRVQRACHEGFRRQYLTQQRGTTSLHLLGKINVQRRRRHCCIQFAVRLCRQAGIEIEVLPKLSAYFSNVQRRMYIVFRQTQHQGQQLQLHMVWNTVKVCIPGIIIMVMGNFIVRINETDSICNGKSTNLHFRRTPVIKEFGTGIGSGRHPKVNKSIRHNKHTGQRILVKNSTNSCHVIKYHNNVANLQTCKNYCCPCINHIYSCNIRNNNRHNFCKLIPNVIPDSIGISKVINDVLQCLAAFAPDGIRIKQVITVFIFEDGQVVICGHIISRDVSTVNQGLYIIDQDRIKP